MKSIKSYNKSYWFLLRFLATFCITIALNSFQLLEDFPWSVDKLLDNREFLIELTKLLLFLQGIRLSFNITFAIPAPSVPFSELLFVLKHITPLLVYHHHNQYTSVHQLSEFVVLNSSF